MADKSKREIARLRDVLEECGRVLQSLDLETDYYIDGTRHAYIKQELVDCLARISNIFHPQLSRGTPAKED